MPRPAKASNRGNGVSALLATIALATSPPAHAADKPPSRGVYLSFTDARGDSGDLQRPPLLGLSLGGEQRRAVMDTGSTAIVVSATAIPNIDQLPNRGPGTLTYSSSGRIMQGDWVVTPVTISGTNGASITTRPIPVLAVRSIDCLENARSCTPREDPRHVAMIGVGFGRPVKHDGTSNPDKNPFLNVAGDSATSERLRRGYIVTREGVQVGLDGADPGGAYVTVPLRWDAERQDWSGAPACIAINDGAPVCGSVLPDTGIAGMFLAVPTSEEEGSVVSVGAMRTLTPGTRVTISLAPQTSDSRAVSSYSFRVGNAVDPLAPNRLILVGDRPTYVNTGLHLFNGFDYLFDADRGIVGYRWNDRGPARSGAGGPVDAPAR
jgi:hypothetical protein